MRAELADVGKAVSGCSAGRLRAIERAADFILSPPRDPHGAAVPGSRTTPSPAPQAKAAE